MPNFHTKIPILPQATRFSLLNVVLFVVNAVSTIFQGAVTVCLPAVRGLGAPSPIPGASEDHQVRHQRHAGDASPV